MLFLVVAEVSFGCFTSVNSRDWLGRSSVKWLVQCVKWDINPTQLMSVLCVQTHGTTIVYWEPLHPILNSFGQMQLNK